MLKKDVKSKQIQYIFNEIGINPLQKLLYVFSMNLKHQKILVVSTADF